MTDREKAIRYLQQSVDSAPIVRLSAIKEHVDACETALAALRAEEEREKGMEWGKMESSGGVLAICPECKYPVSWWHKTPFCGNCGRKLDGGGQDGC